MDQPRSNLFPVLKNSVILVIMEEVNVPLTEAELTEPGRCKERVREVFVQLLHICWGLTDRTLPSLPARILAKRSALSHPSLYDDALPETKFFCLLSKLLRLCGYYEFGFKDLAAPQAKRFRRQLSAVINFLRYREDMGHLEAQALEEREELFSALDEVTGNHMTLEDQLKEAKAVNHEKMLEREEAEAECKEMEAEIAQQNKIQSSIRQETYLLKKSANELKDQIANLSIALRELQAEERQSSKEVVHSPDRIRADLATATRELEGTKESIAERQREKTSVRVQAEHTVSANERVKEITMVMEETESKMNECQIVVEDCDDVKNRLEEVERDLKEKNVEREAEERQLEAVEKQKTDTAAALASALENARDELDSAVRRLGSVESERLDGIAQTEAIERRIRELKSRIERDGKEAEEEISGRIAAFREWERTYRAKEEPMIELRLNLSEKKK